MLTGCVSTQKRVEGEGRRFIRGSRSADTAGGPPGVNKLSAASAKEMQRQRSSRNRMIRPEVKSGDDEIAGWLNIEVRMDGS